MANSLFQKNTYKGQIKRGEGFGDFLRFYQDYIAIPIVYALCRSR